MKHNFERYCKDYENIENYQKALKDNFKGWHCHHRLETHNSDGKRRDVDIPREELKALGMYYNRPASELIFLTISEHNAFKKGKPQSEAHRRKISEALKEHPVSEETRRKQREAKKGEKNPNYGKLGINKGKKLSEETRRKMAEAHKGKRAGKDNPFYGKKHSQETRKKLSEANKGKHWYNNGKENKYCFECPPGFIPGRLKWV